MMEENSHKTVSLSRLFLFCIRRLDQAEEEASSATRLYKEPSV